MGIKIVLIILSVLCVLYLRIMKELNKANKAETVLLTVLAVVFLAVPIISSVAERINNDNEVPLYYKDGDKIYPNQELQNTKPVFAPPAHNQELGDAIYSAVKHLGIAREEVNASPFLGFDVTADEIGSSMLSVKFLFETKERMNQIQENRIEIVQCIIDKYEPNNITFSFMAENNSINGKTMILSRKEDPDTGAVYWELAGMSDGIYKVSKMYKRTEN